MSKYCSMTLDQLRAEARQKNARVSGRKKELIERFEAYDRNRDFRDVETACNIGSEYRMTLPDSSQYVDVNSEKHLPPITQEKTEVYLSQSAYNKSGYDSAMSLYKERYLRYLRLNHAGGISYVKSECRAEMKKSVVYLVNVGLCDDGFVSEAQCECAAGMGPTAHCKHIVAVLCACADFTQRNEVLLEETCTQKLQSFNHGKKYTGSPLKAVNIVMPGADEVTNCSSFDPRPEHLRNMPGYSSYFRIVCLNFPQISTIPIFQIFEPANAVAVAHDHDYLRDTPEDMFLESIGLRNISASMRTRIELTTRGQSTNRLWAEERLKRIHSSNFGRICKATDRTDFQKLARCLTSESQALKTPAILHGKKYEKTALRQYETDFCCKLSDCGIFVSETMPYLAASPDSVKSDTVIIEVKCPYTAHNKDITPETVPYLKVNNDSLMLDRNHNYHFQIQGQLFCTGAKTCILVVYTVKDVKYIHILRDNAFISEMVGKLTDFYVYYFQDALLEKFFYKKHHA